jgi:hypothetical protein
MQQPSKLAAQDDLTADQVSEPKTYSMPIQTKAVIVRCKIPRGHLQLRAMHSMPDRKVK